MKGELVKGVETERFRFWFQNRRWTCQHRLWLWS